MRKSVGGSAQAAVGGRQGGVKAAGAGRGRWSCAVATAGSCTTRTAATCCRSGCCCATPRRRSAPWRGCRQEGVEDGIYGPIEVNVHTQAGKVLTCRSYQMKDYVCGPPSPQYKKVICMGAEQNGLPTDYQKKLEAIETNNYAGPVPIMEEIEAAIKAKKIKSA
ncbi:gamma-glutamylcyclotransferase isoform 2-T2 [Alca torda]